MNTQRLSVEPFETIELPFLGAKTSGKVRELYRRDGQLILITTDRLSAFDRILGAVPYKGQVLNQLAAFWFQQVRDIIGSHFAAMPDPNVTVAQACEPLPVEVVVRGYITGVTETALWTRYNAGERTIYGMEFPEGLRKNDPLPQPIITPTTKAQKGGHDERITSDEVVERGLVDAELWQRVCTAAIAVFQRGQAVAERAGLMLVDTKYEFGLTPDGDLVLIDEVHTPDSSRFWTAESYARFRTTQESGGSKITEPHPSSGGNITEPENFDKEYVRLYYAAHGYRGEGEPMPLPDALAGELSQRYIRAYELLTGQQFEPGDYPVAPRVERNLRAWLAE